MTREWKPGDVAALSVGGESVVGMVTAEDGITVWRIAGHSFFKSIGVRNDTLIQSARPLVVIDPEDSEQVARLEALYLADEHDACENPTDCMADALREFANPTPPKPEEPTGLGALVERADGKRWVRGPNDLWTNLDATGDYLNWSRWEDVAAVKVLSEGVAS